MAQVGKSWDTMEQTGSWTFVNMFVTDLHT